MAILFPHNQADLSLFYLFWVLLYLTINIVWDARSPHTAPFHLAMLQEKTLVGFNAASFASSLLLLLGTADKQVMTVAGDTLLPIMLAGFSGMLIGLSQLCPYKPGAKIFGPPAPSLSHP